MSNNNTRWQKQWQMERARGLKRMVPTDDVVAHIEWLIEQGFTCTAIAKVAGVDRGTVLRARSGKNRLITTKTMKKIMAVLPDHIYARSDERGYVPAVGALRRIQALVTMGWRYKDLDARLGFPVQHIKIAAGHIGREHHEAIVQLYDELWDVRGPGAQKGITRALNRGWQKPMAWDDDTIDDPNAKPFGTVRRAA